MNGFKIGDKVQWTSQSSGVVRTKTGQVSEVVPAGAKPTTKLKDTGSSRNHESYVVRAVADNGTNRTRSYWPHVSKLTFAPPTLTEGKSE